MKNKNEEEFNFKCNNIQASYQHYRLKYGEKENGRDFLVIDVKICDDKIDLFNKNFADDKKEQILQSFLTTILNMKPIQHLTPMEFWMSESSLTEIDIFQHREDLNGYCYA